MEQPAAGSCQHTVQIFCDFVSSEFSERKVKFCNVYLAALSAKPVPPPFSTYVLSFYCRYTRTYKKKKKWYFSRYIHYRNLGDLYEKERREIQEIQVRTGTQLHHFESGGKKKKNRFAHDLLQISPYDSSNPD